MLRRRGALSDPDQKDMQTMKRSDIALSSVVKGSDDWLPNLYDAVGS